jgi:hypothetical protein
MCYRSPNDSTEHYTLTICPWNAIDMLHNPNVSPDEVSVLAPYWKGTEEELPWGKLEEFGYQLFLEGQVFLPVKRQDLVDVLGWFLKPHWLYSEDGETIAIADEYQRDEDKVRFVATPAGRDLLDVIFPKWDRIFMD